LTKLPDEEPDDHSVNWPMSEVVRHPWVDKESILGPTVDVASDAAATTSPSSAGSVAGQGRDVDNGYDFAERLHALVHELGPVGFSSAEKEAFGSYLIEQAVRYVRLGNVAKATGGAS
jgi:hypothetical protein